MTVRLGVCYCDSSGAMSRCVAGCYDESQHCDFFEQSVCGPRCMYYVQDEYCDCWKAYDFFKIHGVITWAMWNNHMDQKAQRNSEPIRIEEEEISLVNIADQLHRKYPARSCSNCRAYPGCVVDPAQYPEGIQQQLAVKCQSYIRK